MQNPAGFIDHTLLSPVTSEARIVVLCEEAVEAGFATVCVPPVFVPLAAAELYGSDVKVCSVVGFPCGYNRARQKVQEALDLVSVGAEELDMVVHLGSLLQKNFLQVEDEIAQVVLAVGRIPVKVIIECCYLDPELMRQATDSVCRAGAACVKTSTGFGSGGATLDDVALLVDAAAGRIGVKAAGGIRTLADCRAFIAAGATRIGTSSGVAIINEWNVLEKGCGHDDI